MQSRDTAVAVFDDRDDAQDAINALRDAGFAPDQISVLARNRDTAGQLAEDTGTEAARAPQPARSLADSSVAWPAG